MDWEGLGRERCVGWSVAERLNNRKYCLMKERNAQTRMDREESGREGCEGQCVEERMKTKD